MRMSINTSHSLLQIVLQCGPYEILAVGTDRTDDIRELCNPPFFPNFQCALQYMLNIRKSSTPVSHDIEKSIVSRHFHFPLLHNIRPPITTFVHFPDIKHVLKSALKIWKKGGVAEFANIIGPVSPDCQNFIRSTISAF
jgi:hypothetical protein